jgi:hypothetical protein
MSSKGRRAQRGSVAAAGAICPVFASFGLTVGRRLRGGLYRSLVWSALLVGLCQAGQAQEAPGAAPSTTFTGGAVTLFQNVRIFDGKSPALSAPSNVLVRGNVIERISASPIAVDTNANVRVIAANGRVLMPGLIDAHWHAFMAATPQPLLMTADALLPPSVGCATGRSDADEGFHNCARPWWSRVRAQARH